MGLSQNGGTAKLGSLSLNENHNWHPETDGPTFSGFPQKQPFTYRRIGTELTVRGLYEESEPEEQEDAWSDFG